MKLVERLRAQRDALLADWLVRIAEAYPKEMRATFGQDRDRFAHPVAATFREGTARLLDALLAEADDDELAIVLDTPIRLRAVQSLKASDAVSFVPDLKRSVRRVLGRAAAAEELRRDLDAFDARIDTATMLAFDAYVACREQLLRLRTASERRMTEQYLRRAGVLERARAAAPDDPDSEED